MRHRNTAFAAGTHFRSSWTRSLLGGLCGVLLLLSACTDSGNPPSPSLQTSTSEKYRLLLVTDPFSLAMDRMKEHMERELQSQIDLEIVVYNDVRTMALQNFKDEVSAYDLIAFDIVWLGEYVEKGVLLPLRLSPNIDLNGFLQPALDTCKVNQTLYGLPIQPHAELLWARADLFEAERLPFPQTTEELLATAKALHNPEEGMYGIAWNAQRGQPLGQTMAHFFAAFGQPLLHEDGSPAFRTEKGLAAAYYALALLEVSPPDILTMAWDQRTSRFASGTVAMTYGWGARSPIVELNPASKVRGKVMYGAAPHAPGMNPVTPLGVWSLGIPSNVRDPGKSRMLLEWLYQEEEQRLLAHNGNGAPPLDSLFAVEELQARYPVLKAMSEGTLRSQLDAGMRPSVESWSEICEILGTEFHEMLLGISTPEESLERADIRCNALLNVLTPTP